MFENVEGLLTFQGGATYRLIHDMFSEIGYNTEGRLMKTHLFAVPQKRKRVIIMCVRKDLNILPSALYPMPITVDEHSQLSARMTIPDLENVECGDDAKYDNTELNDFIAMLKNEISPELFLKILIPPPKSSITTEPVQLSLFE